MNSTIVWDDLTEVTSSHSVRKYKASNIVLFQGEIPPYVLVVRKGFVISYTMSNNGDEQIIAFFSIGDILPVEWVFSRSPVALYYYRAFTDCELVAVSKDELTEHMETNQVLAQKLLNQFASSFIGATVHIHALEHSHSQEKIIKLLHYLVLRFGQPVSGKNETYTIPFKLTHAQIASMVGITRESVTTEAVKLKNKNALTYSKGIYTIKLSELLKSLGSEEFNTLMISQIT
jgi:CRP-like cAMP-binding protein